MISVTLKPDKKLNLIFHGFGILLGQNLLLQKDKWRIEQYNTF